TQFTYFQQVGGVECYPGTGEITYGLERLAMYLQGVDSVYDLVYSDGQFGKVTYGGVFHQNEVEQSTYNFDQANVEELSELSRSYGNEPHRPVEAGLPPAAFQTHRQASHPSNAMAD